MNSARAAAILSDREVGQVNISIGSSLALEGAMGILEDAHNPKPILHQTDSLYINLRTLIRNMIGSVDKEQLDQLHPEDFAWALLGEISVIEGTIEAFTNNRVAVQVYLCNYRSMAKAFPYAILKNANTEKQKYAALREENIVIEFLDKIKDADITILETDIEIPTHPYRVLMMTSYAVDLLQRYKFSSLTLLESHTGATKAPVMWHTKLTGGKDLLNIPFNRMTIQFFGDGGNLFTGFPIKFRRVLLDIAVKNKWNSMTSKDYILSCVKKAHEPELERLMISLFAK